MVPFTGRRGNADFACNQRTGMAETGKIPHQGVERDFGGHIGCGVRPMEADGRLVIRQDERGEGAGLAGMVERFRFGGVLRNVNSSHGFPRAAVLGRKKQVRRRLFAEPLERGTLFRRAAVAVVGGE